MGAPTLVRPGVPGCPKNDSHEEKGNAMAIAPMILKHPAAARLARVTSMTLACGAAAVQLAACGGGALESAAATAAGPVQNVAVKAEAPAHATTLSRGISHALGLWQPNLRYDTCSQAVHDAFAVVGPDGLRYPTWHPPTAIDPDTGKECSFGH